MSATQPKKERVVLSDDDIRIIRERHFGWECAPPSLLARIFGVSHQTITAILRRSA